jgi:hypothetical protein
MPLSIGFTGTRKGLPDQQRHAFDRFIIQHDISDLHHGDCLGADEVAHANFCWLAHDFWARPTIYIHPPNIESMRAHCLTEYDEEASSVTVVEVEPKPYLDRNKDIVRGRDFLLACPEGEETLRSGTWSTVRFARKTGVPVVLFWPDGRVE